MRGAWSRWAVALRIARRSALRSWGRSLLVMALVAAPIAALTGAAVLLPSTASTLDERLANTLGHAQAKITVVGTPADRVKQGVEGGYNYAASGPGAGAHPRYVDPRTVLPASTRVLVIGTGAATFRTPRGAISLPVQTGPTWDPSLEGGPYALLSGRRPIAPDEVLLSPATLNRLGARIGGTVRMLEPVAQTLTVVGTARDRALPSTALTVFGAPALLPGTPAPDSLTYYLPIASVDWATAERLNRAGSTVLSREIVRHPPALPAAQQFGGGDVPFTTVAVVVIALLFAVLEVALLAGAAFAVGARLQQRMLATVASVGGDGRVLRRVVTASGVVLGAAGGVAGIALGFLGAVVLMRLTDDGSWQRYPGLHIPWLIIAGILVFGVLVGWLSALIPARSAAKVDVVRALRGARTPQRIGRRPVFGVVLLAGGIAMTMAGGGVLLAVLRSRTGGATTAQLGALALLGGGPVIAQLGVVLCAGLVLRTVSRLLGRAPLSARLAARDTSRNLARAVPAVAAVMTTVFVASFAMCIGNTVSIYSATRYFWTAATVGQAQSQIVSRGSSTPTAADAQRWAMMIQRTLPVAHLASIATTPQGTDSERPSGRAKDALPQVHFPRTPDCGPRAVLDRADLRCGPFSASGGRGAGAQAFVTVGSLQGLALLLGHAPSAEARDAFAAGGAVALRSDLAPRGVGALDWFTPKQLATGDTSTAEPVRRTDLTTVVDLPTNPVETSLYVSPGTARALHLDAIVQRVLFDFTRPPTDAELDSANTALGALANSPYSSNSISIEHGPQDYGSLLAWFILLACLIIAISAGATAIGLARVDGRADEVTLAALGAPPRIRRAVAFVQALIICGTGAVIGTALGLLPAAALGTATVSYAFAPPTLQLVLTAVGIPVVIAAGSWLLIGRRTNLARRPAIG